MQDEAERRFGGSIKWTERIGSRELFKNDRMQTVHSWPLKRYTTSGNDRDLIYNDFLFNRSLNC